jgi:hypothetical protein
VTLFRFSICIVISVCLVVACSDSGKSPTLSAPETAASVLLPESSLDSGCYGWPDVEFSKTHHAVTKVLGVPGDPAIDFGLRDVDGAMHRLSKLLETRPVFLVLGSFT